MNLNIISYCNSSSYSLVGLNIIKSLLKLGHKSSLFPLHQIDNKEPHLLTSLQESLNNSQTFDYKAPSLHINHQWLLHNNRIGDLKCGMTFFEMDTLTELEIYSINYLDILFVPTNWCKSVINKYCNVTCYVTGLGVDDEVFRPITIVKNRPMTNFLYIGKASLNKGTDFAIRCFQDAFTQKDNVKLWMCIANPFVDMKIWQSNIALSPLKDKISIINKFNTQQDVANFINKCDCLLGVSRAESWNLPCHEAMACGKPIIFTDIGGHEYCHTNSNMKINIDNLEVANDNKFFIPGNKINQGNWAKLEKNQVDQCIEYMRDVHRKNMEGKLSLCQDNIDKANKFSWNNCTKKILDGINGEISANKYSDSSYDV
jgi:glycosyltransferase involved in cell wall biosynthesis